MRIETLLLFVVVLCSGYGYPGGSRTKRKTIFIPPAFGVSCSSGYFRDDSGDCVRVIQLDQNYRVFWITEKLRGIEYEDDYEESQDEQSYIAIQGPPLRLNDDLEKSGIEKRNSETSDKPEPELSTIILPLSSLKQLNAHDTLRNKEINKAIDDYSNTAGRRVSQKGLRRRLRKKMSRSHRPKMKLQLSFLKQKFNKSKSAQGESSNNINSAKLTLTPTPSNLNQEEITTEKLVDTTPVSILTTTLLPLDISTYNEENQTEMETTTSEVTTTLQLRK